MGVGITNSGLSRRAFRGAIPRRHRRHGREFHSRTYTQANLLADRVDGVTYNPAISLDTLQAIKAFAAQEPTILLPSHDPEGPARLANRTTLS
jgi:hypothetical protein